MDRLSRPATNQLVPGGLNMELLAGRKKITLAPGHSLMDWVRLGRTKGAKLSGVSGRRSITLHELAEHNTTGDIWMAIRGTVYNISPYLDYHPGGVDELMRAAGKDGTELFEDIHNWVNVESMLEKCAVGPLIGERKGKQSERTRQTSVVSLMSTVSMKPPIPTPKFDWQQRDGKVVLVVQTTHEDLLKNCVLVDLTVKGEVLLQVVLAGFTYFVHIKLRHPVSLDSEVSVDEGTVAVTLTKEQDMAWVRLGEPLRMHQAYTKTKGLDYQYRMWTCLSNTEVTHDTRLLSFKAPPGLRMITPPGKHIHVKKPISGMEIARSYTVVTSSLLEREKDPEVIEGRKLYLMVKNYSGGALTPWITSLQAGEQITLSNYEGSFSTSRLQGTTHLVCFAAGTGFTSMITIIKYALFEMPKGTLSVQLVFFNKTINDILWRDELDQLAVKDTRFKVCHVLSQESESKWSGKCGRVNNGHIEEYVPVPSDKVRPLLLICGQWAYNDYVNSIARLHGLEDENIHVFSQST